MLKKIKAAVKATNRAGAEHDRAGATYAKAQVKLAERCKALGLLLIEAKKLHPAVKDFEAFLKRVDGLKLARAYELIRITEGRTTVEQVREKTRERVKKHREYHKQVADKYIAEDGGPPVSVTVTETPEVSVEARKLPTTPKAPVSTEANTLAWSAKLLASSAFDTSSSEDIGAFLEQLGPDRFFVALQHAPTIKAEIGRRHVHERHEDDLGAHNEIVKLALECRAHLQNPKPANIETVLKKLARIVNVCTNGAKTPLAEDKKPDLDAGAFSRAMRLDEPAQPANGSIVVTPPPATEVVVKGTWAVINDSTTPDDLSIPPCLRRAVS